MSLATIALIAIAVFFVVGAVLRLAMGPVSLGPFSERLRYAVLNALPGLAIQYDDAALEWSRDEGRVNLIIVGARVFDSQHHIIAQAPKAEIGLAASALISGTIQIQRIALVGVQITLVRTKDGALHLGIERNKSSGDVLQRIRDAIEKSGNGTSSLDRFAVSKARLAFYDEDSGIFLVAPAATVEVANEQTGSAPKLIAHVDAAVEINGKSAHVVGSIRLPKGAENLTGDLSIGGLQLTALAANSKRFAFLKPYDLNTDISASFVVSHGNQLRSADLGVHAKGTINKFGPPLVVPDLQFLGRYDGEAHRILIDDASLTGESLTAHAHGMANLHPASDGSISQIDVEIEADRIALAMPNAFQKDFSLGNIDLQGTYTRADRVFLIQKVLITHSAVSGELRGRVAFADNTSPGIDLSGHIGALSVHDLIRAWPLQAAEGARTWIAANFQKGNVGPVTVSAHMLPGALDKPFLPDEALNVSFPVSNASVDYLHGLPLITNANGSAVLRGDTFELRVSSGRVGALALDNADVTIPKLHEHGTVGAISATLKGEMRGLLEILDHKPLQYPTRFHIHPNETTGAVVLAGSLHVPMIKGIGIDKIPIAAKAVTRGLAISLSPKTRLTDGDVTFDIDNTHLHAIGNVKYGAVPLGIEWTEAFSGQTTTRLKVRGLLDEQARSALKLNVSDILSGPVGVTAEMTGHQGQIRTAHATVDLAPATISLSPVSYSKAAGVPATAQISTVLDAAGNMSTADVSVTGAGLAVQGRLNFAADGSVARAEFPSFHAGTNNDFSLSMGQSGPGIVDVSIKGHSADGTAFGRRNPSTSKGRESGTSYHVTARLDRFVLKENTTLSPFSADATTVGSKIQSLSLRTGISKGDVVTADISSAADGRNVTVNATDAGALLRGIFGLNDVSGGRLSIAARMPPIAGANGAPDYTGTLTIKDFKIENQPFFARLFSAGSLGGLLDLMRGSGIVIDKLEMPFSAKDEVINIHDGHAAGPSVGLSGDGYIDRGANRMEMRGAVAPIYGLNGMLGALPILGNMLVSKKGEGIFGVTYYASGNLDEPNLSVNPLSMLTPGILRRIFEGKVPTAPEHADKTEPAPATAPH